MNSQHQSGSRFIVDLGDVKLPPVVEKHVEAEIQAVVLRALAESAVGGQRAEQDRISRSIWGEFPGQTLGLWPGYPKNPPDIFGSEGGGSLVVRDHTVIMKAILEHPMQVIRYLPKQYKSKTGPRPSGREVLQAALQVEQIDNLTKSRIRAVLEVLPQIEEGQAALPESTKRAIDDLRQRLSNTSFEEKRRLYRDDGLRNRYRSDGGTGLAEGMEFAARILEDGRDSIYSLDHSFYKMVLDARRSSGQIATAREDLSLGQIADADGVGGAAGGAIGTLAGGVGAGPGAVAGAAGASAGAAIGQGINAIADYFDWW